ncbi:MAG: TIM barrel protein [bacterium]
MKITVASFSFHGLLNAGMMDIFGYLETVRYRFGLDAADIWSGTLASLDDDYIRKVREALDERELVLANLCVDGPHPWEDDVESRVAHRVQALKWMKAAEILGAKTLRIDMGGTGETFTEEQYDYVVKRFKEYAKRAWDNGYRVGPETHWGPELTLAVQQRVCEEVDHPGYGILLHLGHWNGGPEAEVAGDIAIAPWVMHTHVDARLTAAGPEPRLRAVRDAGYEGYWGVEHHSANNEYAELAWQLGVIKRAESRLIRGEA